MDDRHQSNRAAWNEAATSYKASLETGIEFLKKGGTTFFEPELKHLGPLKDSLSLCVHLQCAGGSDTLSLINFGAKEVVGLDISEEMIKVAKAKSDALKMNAKWLHSDVLNAPSNLNGSADLVYTGKGAINWMMDIDAWALVVERILKPGGFLYLFEGHPITYCFDMNASELKIDPIYQGYFFDDAYASQDWPDNYIGKLNDSVKEQAVKYERPWPVSMVITALIKAGLSLQAFEEHPEKYWDEFQNLPDDLRRRFPNTYSLLAMKPIR